MPKQCGYCETRDGAKIYFEDEGKGQPLVLIHGWNCSGRFWRRNVPGLAGRFRVITMDLRGHGNSSKILSGHTIADYAKDVRTLLEYLELSNAFLVGWSMGGPVVLAYWRQYLHDHRLSALGLVDTAPAPFSSGDWNSHGLKDSNVDSLNAALAALTADPRQFYISFATNMFKNNPSPQDLDWIVGELAKTPPWIAGAIYSDFVISDYTAVLPTITVPAIVFACDSRLFADGIKMGRYLADHIPSASFTQFTDAGHILFYEQPEVFNQSLRQFVARLV
ncbi:MAG TPA: alpha/beta hydrolase [Negativicutes bacterium]|nr:alpha/beta hydrolase [Negativicutes bacterium]